MTACETALVSFSTEETVGDVVYANGAEAEVVAQGNGYVHIRVAKDELVSLNDFYFSADEDGEEELGYLVYRYLGTKYTGEGTADTSWYELYADDESVDTYVIATSADLAGVASLVNDGTDFFAGKTILMVADIVLNAGAPSMAGNTMMWYTAEQQISASNLITWTPIGGGNAFAGTFDGNGHSISGLYGSAGLFGYTNHGSLVQNTKLVNSYINGGGGIAAFAGKCCGQMNNLYTNAIIRGTGMNVGGIAGESWFEPSSASMVDQYDLTFTNCWFAGDLYSTGQRAGGITGGLCTNDNGKEEVLKLTDCLVTGKVNTTNSATGGLVGFTIRPALELTRCIVAPSEMSVRNDMIGQSANSLDHTIVIHDCYVVASEAGDLVQSSLTGAVMDIQNSARVTEITEALLSAASYDLTNVWSVSAEGVGLANGARVVQNNVDFDAWYYDDADAAGGNGDGKFVISSVAEFLTLPTIASSYNFAGKTVELATDIKLNDGNAQDWKAGNTSGLTAWTPIKEFAGTFDGKGHTISGMYVNTNPAGMFNYTTGTSVIKNFKLTNSYIQGGNNSGSIAAECKGKLIDIYSDAIVSGTWHVGGLAGAMWNDDIADHSTNYTGAIRCWFAGEVFNSKTNGSAGRGPGGIVGFAASSGSHQSYPLIFEDCLVTGSVTDTFGDTVGGVIGYFWRSSAEITRCVVTTTDINGNSCGEGCLGAGPLIGVADSNITTGVVTNCFAVAETAGTLNPAGHAKKALTVTGSQAVLTITEQLLSDASYDLTNVWSVSADGVQLAAWATK